MLDYIKFWVAQALVGAGLAAGLIVLALLVLYIICHYDLWLTGLKKLLRRLKE